jgi:hypothetical protein
MAEENQSTDEVLPETERHWMHQIHRALDAEQFEKLDRMAAEVRQSKARLPGGGWRLEDFYGVVDAIGANDAETEARIARLERWIAARPQSITPRVAMAGVLHRWAWRARGSATADKVTEQGWQLLAERLKRADKVLTEAQKLPEACPHLYFDWLKTGLGLDWEPGKMRALFDQAVKAEPDYILDYHIYANYLQPKWDGQPGEATAFAKTAADRIGGPEGDMIYFQIALSLIHRGNPGIHAKEMDWTRIQRGYTATRDHYGVTNQQDNRMAYMAWKFRDRTFAAQQFQIIGDHWSKKVWGDRETFDKARQWGTGPA